MWGKPANIDDLFENRIAWYTEFEDKLVFQKRRATEPEGSIERVIAEMLGHKAEHRPTATELAEMVERV